MYTEIINKNQINNFLNYCENINLSKKTINNYKADINLFEKYLKTHCSSQSFLSEEVINGFINYQKYNKKSVATINRTLSTLRSYFSYINSIGISIDLNILKIKNKKDIYKNFVNYLNSQKLSLITKTNYKSDISSFFDWAKNKNINEELLEKYQVDYYLNEITNKYSKNSLNRKKSSFDFFWNWYQSNKTEVLNFEKLQTNKNKYYENLIYFSFMAGVAVVITTYSAINKLNNDFNWSKYINPNQQPQNVIYASDKKDYKFTLKDSFEKPDQNISNSSNSLMIVSKDDNFIEYQAAGKAEINKGDSFVIISNSNINNDSVIIITPTNNLNKNSLYVSSQKDGIAVISLSFEAESTIGFNYLII